LSADENIAMYAPNFAATSAAMSEGNYTAGTVPASMPPSLLLTEEPSDRSRLLTHDPYDSYWYPYFEGPDSTSAARNVSGLGLVNVNLSRVGHYRFVAGINLGEFNLLDHHAAKILRVAPTGIVSSANIVGTVANVDESPRLPDANWIEPNLVTQPWNVSLSFPTPASEPAPGAFKQAFVLWVKRTGGDAEEQRPVLEASLFQGGTPLGVLDCKVVTVSTGQILIFRWDASLLIDSTGAGVGIGLAGSASGNTYVSLGAAAWDCETGASVGWNVDSGWLASPFDAASARWGGSPSDDGVEPVKNLDFRFASANITGWTIFFSDDQSQGGYLYASGLIVPARRVRQPQGYAQAGVAVAAPLFQPASVNFAHGPMLAARDASTSALTLGGQDTGVRRRPRRSMPVSLPQLTAAEGHDLFERVDWRRGKKLPLFVVRYPAAAAATRRQTALWCTLEEMPGLSVPAALGKTSWSGVFVEKL
jgi:hypothetical protein